MILKIENSKNKEKINKQIFGEEEMKFEKLCASGNCNSMPSKQKMQIKVNWKTLSH